MSDDWKISRRVAYGAAGFWLIANLTDRYLIGDKLEARIDFATAIAFLALGFALPPKEASP